MPDSAPDAVAGARRRPGQADGRCSRAWAATASSARQANLVNSSTGEVGAGRAVLGRPARGGRPPARPAHRPRGGPDRAGHRGRGRSPRARSSAGACARSTGWPRPPSRSRSSRSTGARSRWPSACPPEDADPTSEVGRVGQAFNHMLNNVEDALAARQASETKVRQFVADASHELRNPLAAIRGYAELTRRERDSMSPNAAFAMSRVESEAERMSYLVEDLLLLARLDSGPNLDVRPVDLSEVVINALSDARAAGPDHVLAARPAARAGRRARGPLPPAPGGGEPPGQRPDAHPARHPRPRGRGPRRGERGDHRDRHRARASPRTSSRASSSASPGPRSAASGRRAPQTGRSTGLGLAIVAAVVEAHHGTVGGRQPARAHRVRGVAAPGRARPARVQPADAPASPDVA